MAESFPPAWISDYLIDVAETHGAQLYDAPLFNKKKRVQLTEFLTFHENSYVWAWASDKTHRIPIRISKEAAEEFKGQHCDRSVIDHRFAMVFIQHFRPIFSPRPLGGTAEGNTPTPHLALEVSYVKSIAYGAHVFGDPKDVESNSLVHEWVMGLRQDGGGGNVLKLRKQERKSLVQVQPPARLPTPNLIDRVVKSTSKLVVTEQMPDPVRPQRPIDFKRAYSKRWRALEIDRWKFAHRPPQQITNEPGSSNLSKNLTEVPRTPEPTSPAASVRRGTPTDWSPSPRRSPMQANFTTSSSRNPDTEILSSGLGVHPEEPASHLPSSRAYSLQSPTPAQRKRVSPPPLQSQRASSPLPSSSPVALPGSPTNLRKNVKRKVPHPGIPPLFDPNHSGPTQILVPNSDTSGMMSSQPYSQPSQPRTLFPSSLSSVFKPGETSTPKKTSQNGHSESSKHVLGTSAEATSSQPVQSVPCTLAADEHGLPGSSRIVDRGILSEDDAETEDVLRKAPCPAVVVDSQAPSSPSSMHSLFSASPTQEQESTTMTTPNKPASAPYDGGTTPAHDPEIWKEPSFMRSRKAKRSAASEEVSDEKGNKKRTLSNQPTPLPKRIKMDERLNIENQTASTDVQTPNRKTLGSRDVRETPQVHAHEVTGNDHLTLQRTTTRSQTGQSRRKSSRLAGLTVDFTQIPYGPNHQRPQMTWADFRAILLRTGRIRTSAEVERNGSVYLEQD